MTDIGISLTVQALGGALSDRLVAPPLLPVGATFAWVGDGLISPTGGVGLGTPNAIQVLQTKMAGRIQPAALSLLAMSGTTIRATSASNYAWVYPYALDAAVAQKPNILGVGPFGHNDNVLSTDPSSSSGMQDWKDAVSYAAANFQGYAGPSDRMVVVGTVASKVAGESAWRAMAWTAQMAHVATLGDSRISFVDVSSLLPPESYSIDSSGLYTHWDERGAGGGASLIFAALDVMVEQRTPDQIRDLIGSGTYPLMAGTQLDGDEGLAGTSGTVTGPGVVGVIATSKAIANTTGATGIAVAQAPIGAGMTETVVGFTASSTTTAAGRVVVQDKSNISVSATPGQAVVTGMLVKATGPFRNFGADWNGNLYGLWGAGGASLSNNARAGADVATDLDTLVLATPLSLFGSSATYNGKRSVALSWSAGVVLSGSIRIRRWFTYLLSERTLGPPVYLGDVSDANNNKLTAATQRLRPSGSISQGSGGTIRVEPGLWYPRGMTETDFIERRIYKGSPTDTGVGTGILLATVSGSNWTTSLAAGQVNTGDLIYVEIDAISGYPGSPIVTARSKITLVAS